MDAFYTPDIHTATGYQQPPRLADVRDPAFTIINDFLNLCVSKGIPFSWIVNVHHHRNIATNNSSGKNLPGQTLERLDLSESPISPTPESGSRRFDCHKCPTTLGCRKEFLRHLAQKCELLKVWYCPDCQKEFKRFDHLRYHHKRHGYCLGKDCNHLVDAGCDVPRKTILGCGYCVCYFEDTQDFCCHLANHFQKDATKPHWNPTRSVESLLQHPRIHTTWKNICTTRFGVPEEYWPSMTWTTKHTEGDEVRTLEYSTDGQDLQFCLAKLLENGLEAGFIDRSGLSLSRGGYTMCPDFTRIDMPYGTSNSYMPPHRNMLNGNVQQMFDSDTWSFETPFGSTTSTLINTDGVSEAPHPPMSSPSEFKQTFDDISHEEAPMLAGSDTPFDGDIDPMDFISFEPAPDSFALGPYTGEYGSTEMLVDSPTLKGNPAEALIMSSIPSSYAYTNTHTHNFPSPADGTIAPMKTVYTPSTPDPNLPYKTDYLAPPYNATPQLPARHSHKRSLSDRILRKLM